MLESVGVRPRPTWVRGPAFIDGDEIVLAGGTAERYAAFDPEHATRLLLDLGNLGQLGEIGGREVGPDARLVDTIRLKDTDRALKFAKTHGLLCHGPTQVGKGEVRESLMDWFFAGQELTFTTALYLKIRQAQDDRSAEPVYRYLQTLRDAGIFKHISLSDDDSALLEYACIQLAERISHGIAECTPTFSAACGLLKDGTRVGGVGDFRFGNDPGSLIGAANYHLASLVSRKILVRECKECEEMFIPEDPRQTYHPKCGARKRQRESRQRRKGR
jgi:hypothetical protein